MDKCSGCKVARYCCRAHQEQAWMRGRLGHKAVCPLMNRWRKVKDGKATVQSCSILMSDFFESILVVSDPAGIRPDVNVAKVDEQYDVSGNEEQCSECEEEEQ